VISSAGGPAARGCAERSASGGFTLVELAIVILIIGLIAGIGADLMRGFERRGRIERTEAALAGVEEALALFVMRHKRLPCPAEGTLADDHPDSGRENFEGGGPGDCERQANGTVPTVALGIGAAAGRDGWNRRIAYRVDPVLTRDRVAGERNCGIDGACVCRGGGIDLSCVDPLAIGPGEGGIDDVLSAFHDTGLGLRVCAAAGCPEGSELMAREAGTGAAYVLVSHGRTGLGAFTNGGTRIEVAVEETAVHERPNLNGIGLDEAQAGPSGGGGFVDRERNDRDERELEAFFDDYVVRPSVLRVARDARLEPQAAR
jgi:prepilin-type N-terminal cleavage/methylation domain-containing protein